MTERKLEDGFDACAGCGRLCIQKRVVMRAYEAEVKAICVAPWCARVATRSRACAELEGGDGRITMREFATVCSMPCFSKMLADPAWEKVKGWAEEVRKATLFIGEDKLVPRYGAKGLIPPVPQTGWLLADTREPIPEWDGPYR